MSVIMRRINGWLTIFWTVMIPVSVATGWVHSVTYISALSLWALVSGHWSAWQAARVEVTQQAEATEATRHPVEDRIVDALVERTTLTPERPDHPSQSTLPLTRAKPEQGNGLRQSATALAHSESLWASVQGEPVFNAPESGVSTTRLAARYNHH